MSNPRSPTGFTILEILVVIAIISILSAVLLPNIFFSKKEADRRITKAQITQIQGMIERYKIQWGDYPPTVLPGFTDANNLNQGIETLVACLANTTRGGPYLEWEEKRYTNYDNDSAGVTEPTWLFGDNQLREIVDVWSQPFVYFHSLDYENPDQYSDYLKEGSGSEQATFAATPQISSVTNTYHNPYSYQLWSIGPDGENDNGADDDITNW